MSLVCICLTAPTLEANLTLLDRYRQDSDLAELRLDLLKPSERSQAGSLVKKSPLPLILTARLEADGGYWGQGPEEGEAQRAALLTHLLTQGGWCWVDLEEGLDNPEILEAAAKARTKIIRSRHDIKGMPEDIPGVIRSLAAQGDIPKLAVTPQSSRDLLHLARGALVLEGQDKILLGMGEWGIPTRILADRCGSLWTYASALGETSASEGQLDPWILKERYRFRDIGPNTPLYGVVGDPIAHSRSPELHNCWLQKASLPGTYLALRAEELAPLLELADLWGLQSLSVTVPHKKEILKLAEFADLPSRNIGAANTLIRGGDGWRARNTDVTGFLSPLREYFPPGTLKDRTAVIIGAGGAARSVAFALAKEGASLLILNRTLRLAEELAALVKGQGAPLIPDSMSLIKDHSALVVQTTSVGMAPFEDQDPAPWFDFSLTDVVYDLVYEPKETLFLARARESGCCTINGTLMLEAQAKEQFRMFTGVPVPQT